MIYFVQETKHNRIKIGHTTDLNRRLLQLRQRNPTPIQVLGITAGDQRMESSLHRKFRYLNTHGEWFAPAPELLLYILTCAQRYDPPWVTDRLSQLYGSDMADGFQPRDLPPLPAGWVGDIRRIANTIHAALTIMNNSRHAYHPADILAPHELVELRHYLAAGGLKVRVGRHWYHFVDTFNHTPVAELPPLPLPPQLTPPEVLAEARTATMRADTDSPDGTTARNVTTPMGEMTGEGDPS